MNESLKKLLCIVDVNGKITGRKKFQKLIYILKQKDFDFKEDYSYYYYGPYSSTLRMEIDSLVQSNLLEECSVGTTYEYGIADQANDFIQRNYFSKDEISFIKSLNEKPAYILELVSVFFYLEDKGYNNESILKNKTRILKPELSKYIDKAYELYLDIKNIEIN